MAKLSTDEKLFFRRIIPQKIKQREYYDYSSVIMFLEYEYVKSFDLDVNNPNEPSPMALNTAESVVANYIQSDPTYLIRTFIVNNSKNIEHMLKGDDDNTQIFQAILLKIIGNLKNHKFISSIFSGGVLTKNFENIYLNCIKGNDDLIDEINELIYDLEF